MGSKNLRLVLLALLLGPSIGSAQQAPDPPPRPGLKVHRSLVDLDRVEKGTATAAESLRVERGPVVSRRDDGAIRVEIVAPAGSTVPSLSTDPRVEDLAKFANVAEAWIRPEDLLAVAAALPEGAVILPAGDLLVGEDAIEGQGPDVTRSDQYRDVGLDGSDLTIAVIDGSWNGIYESIAAGDAPPIGQLSIFNLSASTTFTSGDSKHGVGCLETIYDHAPGATYYAFKASSSTTLAQAVDTAILLGADIISHSMSRYNLGWNDDEGAACQAANLAGQNGILFFTSAGNRQETHFQGDFTSGDGDDWHDWSGDETINVTIPADSTARLYLSWDTSGGLHDYDLYLLDGNLDILALSDTAGEGYEVISFENDDALPVFAQIAIFKAAGDGTELELFQHGGGVWDQHATPIGSTTSPSNATHPNVISVGAVRWQDYDAPPGTAGQITNYSSVGPTNDFMIVPDLCGPTSTSGFAIGVFAGTSCSTPNAAGAAAVLWSCDPGLPSSTVREELFDFANIRDWGFPGKEIFTGEGGLILPTLIDCNSDGDPDACDILAGAIDANDNGRIDFCEGTGIHLGLQIPTTPVDPLASLVQIPATLIASEIPEPGDPLTPLNGFTLTLALGSPTAIFTSVEPSTEIQALNSGGGPSFFNVTPSGPSVVIETVFNSAALDTLTVEQETPLANFVIQDLMSTFNQAETFEFTPGANQLLTASGASVVPTTVDGLIVPEDVLRFRFDVPELTLAYDPADSTRIAVVRPEFSQITGGLDAIRAFNATLLSDDSILVPQSVTPLGPLTALNGGAGPELFLTSLGPGFVTVDCLFSAISPTTIVLDPGVRPFAILYETVPGVITDDLDGLTTPLVWDESAPNTVLSPLTGTQDVDRVGGWLTFLPELDHLFIRGDFDGSGQPAINDAILMLDFLFSGGPVSACPDSADVTDDGILGIADPIVLLDHLFAGGPPPPPPGASFCGPDPTLDALGPCAPSNCPEPPDEGGLDG